MPRCAVIPCEKNRGVACDTNDTVISCEAGESRPVVTVLVTRLPRRSKQELGRPLVRARGVDRAMDPTPLLVAEHRQEGMDRRARASHSGAPGTDR